MTAFFMKIYKKGVKTLYPTFYPYEDGTYRPYEKLEEAEITGDIKRIDNMAFCLYNYIRR